MSNFLIAICFGLGDPRATDGHEVCAAAGLKMNDWPLIESLGSLTVSSPWAAGVRIDSRTV